MEELTGHGTPNTSNRHDGSFSWATGPRQFGDSAGKIALVVLASIALACILGGAAFVAMVYTISPNSQAITYEIAGPDRAVVEMNYDSPDDADDSLGESVEVRLPWRLTVQTEENKGSLPLFVGTEKPLSGPVTCRIWKGSLLLAERTITTAEMVRQIDARGQSGVVCHTVGNWHKK